MYGFIMQHLSVESKDEIAQEQDYEIWSKALDAEKLWLAIVKTHKVDCVSNVNEVKELAARKLTKAYVKGRMNHWHSIVNAFAIHCEDSKRRVP